TVAIDHTIAQMNAVSRSSNDPFDHVQAGLSRREEHDDVSALDVAVVHNGPDPAGAGRELNAVHKNVIAHQQGVFHRAGGDLESLNNEGDDEQPGDQHRGERGKKLNCSFALFFWFLFFFGHGRSFGSEVGLMYQPERTVRATDLEQLGHPIQEVHQFITGSHGPRQTVLAASDGPVNQQWTANDVLPRHKAPIAAVKTLVAIVPHHKILARRNDEVAMLHHFLQLFEPESFFSWCRIVDLRKGVTINVVHRRAVKNVFLFQRQAIHPHLPVHQPHVVSGNSNDAFHEVLRWVYWIVKNDNVAAL